MKTMLLYASPAPSATRRTEARSHSSDCPPADFDASAYPIISQHWFGIEPARSLNRQRQIEHVHRLGARAVAELLHEVAAGENLDHALESYGRLTPDLLKALGGDRFPALPVHVVQP